MSKSTGPASPLSDLVAWHSQSGGRVSNSVLTPDLIALAQQGVSVSIAVCHSSGRPIAGVGIGCRVNPNGTMRVLVSAPANAVLLDMIRNGAAVAVTFTSAPDHRAFQVKADSATICDPSSDDQPELARQCAVFRDGLVEIGFSPALAAGYTAFDPSHLQAIEFVPRRVFTQTPGPGAGAELVT